MEILDPTLFHPVGTVGIINETVIKVSPRGVNHTCLSCICDSDSSCAGYQCAATSRRDSVSVIFKKIPWNS